MNIADALQAGGMNISDAGLQAGGMNIADAGLRLEEWTQLMLGQ